MAERERHGLGLRPDAVAVHDRLDVIILDLDIRAHPGHTRTLHLTCMTRVLLVDGAKVGRLDPGHDVPGCLLELSDLVVAEPVEHQGPDCFDVTRRGRLDNRPALLGQVHHGHTPAVRAPVSYTHLTLP